MGRRDAGYAYRARCPHCKGPLYYIVSSRLYFCANHACPGGEHGAGVLLTDEQVEHDDAMVRFSDIASPAVGLSGRA